MIFVCVGGECIVILLCNDYICWFEMNVLSEVQLLLVEVFEILCIVFNCSLMFGLVESEVYYVVYVLGVCYVCYFDCLCYSDVWMVLVVYYFNEVWDLVDGGVLCLYLDDGYMYDVLLQVGMLVLFLFDCFEYEVLLVMCECMSVVCWMCWCEFNVLF